MRSRRSRGPKPNRRRALELIACSPDGMTEAMLLAHGFTVDMLADLIRAGLATAKTERLVAGGRPMEVPACGSPAPAGGRSQNRRESPKITKRRHSTLGC